MSTSDLSALIGPVARELLGDPNLKLSSKTELRYGARGSIAVDLAKGVWHDHETGQGGGLLDLVQRETGKLGAERFDWLHAHGYDVERSTAHKPNGKAGTAIVATYDYVDEEGALLFQVCRLDPKDFRQRKPDGDGWTWSTKGVRQVPYRLPELIESIAQQQIIFIVEGEKDADRLAAIGAPATTNAGGAGKWKPALNDYFAGADVVIIEDNDPQKKHPKTGEPMQHDDGRPILPGQDHAQDIARQLDGIAARVRVLSLKQFWPAIPPKGDVSDWLQDGSGSVEQLYDIIERVPDWSPTAPTTPARATLYIFPANIPPRSWIHGGHYVRGVVTATVAPGGFGKTTLALFEAISMALAGYRVWYLSGEDQREELDRRIAAHCQQHGIEPSQLTGRLFVDDKASFPLDIGKSPRTAVVTWNDDQLARFEQAIEADQIDVVLLDPFIAFHSVPEGDNGAIDQVVKRLAAICARRNCCIEINHHVRKASFGQTELTVEDTRGGSAIVNAVRSSRVINRMSEKEADQARVKYDQRSTYLRLDRGKRNMAPPEAAIWFHLVSVHLPNGDNVQAIEKWEFPSAFDGMSDGDIFWVQSFVKESPRRASSQSDDWLGHYLGTRLGRDTTTKDGAIWANKVLGQWLRNKVIKKVTMRDPESRKPNVPFYVHLEFAPPAARETSANLLPFKARGPPEKDADSHDS